MSDDPRPKPEPEPDTVEQIMRKSGVDEVTARFIHDIETGASDGDVVEVDDQGEPVKRPPQEGGDRGE